MALVLPMAPVMADTSLSFPVARKGLKSDVTHEQWQKGKAALTESLRFTSSSGEHEIKRIGEGQRADVYTMSDAECLKVFKEPGAAAHRSSEVRASNVALGVYSNNNKRFTRPLSVREVEQNEPGMPALVANKPALCVERFAHDVARFTGKESGDKHASLQAKPGVREAAEQLVRDVRILHEEGVAHGDIHTGNVAVRTLASGGLSGALNRALGAKKRAFEFVLFDYGEAAVSPFSAHYKAFKAWTRNDVRLTSLETALSALRSIESKDSAAFTTAEKFESKIMERDIQKLLRIKGDDALMLRSVIEDQRMFLKHREYDEHQLRTLTRDVIPSSFGSLRVAKASVQWRPRHRPPAVFV